MVERRFARVVATFGIFFCWESGTLAASGVAISMDGCGRWLDNVFTERLWRSLEYEDIYLRAYADGREAKAGIAMWFASNNAERPFQALADRMSIGVQNLTPPPSRGQKLHAEWQLILSSATPQ